MGDKKSEVKSHEQLEKEAKNKKFEKALNIIHNYLAVVECNYEDFRKNFKDDKEFYNYLISFQEGSREAVEEMNLEEYDMLRNVSFIKTFRDVHETVENYLKENDITDKAAKGEILFLVMRASYLEVVKDADVELIKSVYKQYENPLDLMTGKNNLIEEMTRLMDSGDRYFRGSSKAYKEIQDEIKDLGKVFNKFAKPDPDGNGVIIDPMIAHYVSVMASSIAERCENYVNARENVAMKLSPYSYKGRRVSVVKKVRNRLLGFISACRDKNIFKVTDKNKLLKINDNYKKMIDRKLCNTTFSKTIYAESKALEKYNALGDVVKNQAENIENPAIFALGEGLKGTICRKEDLDAKFAIASGYTAAAQKLVKDAEGPNGYFEPLNTELRSINQLRKRDCNNPLVNITDRNNLPESTGIPALDHAILKAYHYVLAAGADKVLSNYEDENVNTNAIDEAYNMSFF